jgi:hypothetical protein
MTRSAAGAWALPTNSFNDAAAGTVIEPDDWNETAADIEAGFNEHIYCALAANYTLTDTASAQKVFNASSNGAVTLVSATTYKLDALYILTNTGTSSHTWGTLFAGTATFTSGMYRAVARTGITGASTLTATLDAYTTSIGSELVCTAASTSATEQVLIKLDGIVRINAGGTFIPQIKASAAPSGGVQTMLANSFISLRPLGSNTVAIVPAASWS